MSFLVTFTMRTWSKIYVSDKVSDKQMAAVEALLPIAFAGFHRGMLSFTKAPITMNITESRVIFSGPESSVEMNVMRGFGDKPVQIANLPNPAYQGYTQYRSVSHTHKSAQHTFSHAGTNGFTSTMDVGSKWQVTLLVLVVCRVVLGRGRPRTNDLTTKDHGQYPAALPAADRPSDPPCSHPPSLTMAATWARTTPGE